MTDDELRSAVLELLLAWDEDDELEQQDLSDRMWAAVARLRRAVL